MIQFRNSLPWLCALALFLPVAAAAVDRAGDPVHTPAPGVQTMIERLGLRESGRATRDFPGWEPPRRVVAFVDDPQRLAGLQAAAPGAEIVLVSSVAEAADRIAGADVLLGSCDEEILSRADRLKWVQVYSAGVDRCVGNPGMRKGDKLLTNGQRIASPALAEHAIALTLALARGLDRYMANQAAGVWERDIGLGREDIFELQGRTMLVVGLGGIGTQVASRAHGLGMRVIATRHSRREGPDYVDYVGLAGEAPELARQADVVVNAAPLTDETRGMFNAAFFEAMKPTAFFVSVGRGGSTVTDDLVAALREGRIAGAGLDVTDPEPLPPGHPLWTMPRVIITPHVAGRSDRSRDRLFLLVQENLRRYAAGEPLLSEVDIERGY